MRHLVGFLLLMAIKICSRLLYRFDTGWVGEIPDGDPWAELRVAAFLHHTSLLEILYFGIIPNQMLWRLARHGVVPAADITMDRPFVGPLYRAMAHRVVSVTRQRDATWEQVLNQIGPDAFVLLAPEGRMMRADGRDKEGKPMTIRGGIGDILATVGSGRFLIAYSGGLHHVQVPGQRWARPFRRLRIRLETLDLDTYRQELRQIAEQQGCSFKRALIADLEARKARHCPFIPGSQLPVVAEG